MDFGGRRSRHQEDCEALTRSGDLSKSILPYNYSIICIRIYIYIYTFVFALFDIYIYTMGTHSLHFRD